MTLETQGIEGPIGGEFMMRISRIIPDFGAQTGTAKVYLNTKEFPSSTATSTSYNATNINDSNSYPCKSSTDSNLKIGNVRYRSELGEWELLD